MSSFIRRVEVAALIAVLAIASGCGYTGSATKIDPAEFDLDLGWISVKNIRIQMQKGDNDCGSACLAMVLTHWGLPTTPGEVDAACPPSDGGSQAGQMRNYVKTRGLQSALIHGTLEDLNKEMTAGRPVIVGLIKPYTGYALPHYEVVVAINPAKKLVATLDPARGPRQNTYEGFLQEWEPAKNLTLIVIGSNASGRLRPGSMKSDNPVPSPLMPGPGPDGQPPSPSGSALPVSSNSGVSYREREAASVRLHD